MQRNNKPRHRRVDLLEALPWGAQSNISRVLKISPSVVSTVLNGTSSQDTDIARNIIRLAEQRVEIEKSRSRKRKY